MIAIIIMKKTILFGLILLFIAVCSLFLSKKSMGSPNPLTQTMVSIPPENSQHPTNESIPNTERPQTSEQMTNPTEALQQKLNSLGVAPKAWANQVQRPIEFYGKVIDENGQPVDGANISFSWNQFMPEQSFETNAFSDANGLFSVVGLAGATLGVHVQKDGYYSVKANPIEFQYWKVLDSSSFQPDAGNPVIFHLRKKGSGTNLTTAFLNVKVPRDGTSVSVDFLNRTFGADGQLQISQVKPPYETWKRATAWSFKMEIPDGGFIEQNDEFPFEAPASGYQPVIDFNFDARQPGWKTLFTKSYYLVFGSPPKYGRLTVETDISWGGARITYAINPSGSRNLEPK